jgi:CRISPR-associated endonuclease/helicase Cas3
MFAHSVPGSPDTSRWEPLADHLEAVGARAATFASIFGFGPLGEIAGRLHDIGKASSAYQSYIQGVAGSRGPDHSTAGARVARERFGNHIGQLIAYAIAGHHAGLANGSGFDGKRSSLSVRLSRDYKIPAFDGWEREAGPLPEWTGLQKPVPNSIGDGFHRAFLVRMLFSCLVDADFLETERFYAEAEGRPVPDRGGSLHAEDLANRLEAFMSNKRQGSDLGRLRADIRAHALDKAAEAPGLFTLTVPTGGGKTLTSLSFALEHARRHDLRRIVYVIPFTSIIEQTASVFREALGLNCESSLLLEHHSAFDWDRLAPSDEADREEEGRAGEAKLRRAAENWDVPIVITTSVQFYESLFAARPSRCRKLHNLARSIIILDEVQTLPVHLLRPSMAALQELSANYSASVVMCTATQPALRQQDGALPRDVPGFDVPDCRELAPNPPGLYQRLRRVAVERLAEPVSDDEIAARFAEQPQMLAIVGSRAHARDLFEAIQYFEGAFHLSTLMCAAHRSDVLANIKRRLIDEKPVRLVSTSLIEAGVDIDFPEVWRAEAGLESIAQAAGRCNRENKLGRPGRVVVFRHATQKPPAALRPFHEAAALVADRFDDPLGLDSIRAYYRELYFQRGADRLDKPNILKRLGDGAPNLDFAFEDIADAFRLIDEMTEPVLIPWDDRAKAALRTLASAEVPPRDALRTLQRYTVPVPPATRRDLVDTGTAVAIQPEHYGDRFVRLATNAGYDSRVGLRIDLVQWRTSEQNIV